METNLSTAQEALARLDRRKPPDPVEGPSEALLAAGRQLARLGLFDKDIGRLRAEAQQASAARQVAEEAARADERSAAPPPLEEGERAEAQIKAARDAYERAREAVERADLAMLSARERAASQSAGDVPTAAAIEAARAERDTLWYEILRHERREKGQEGQYRTLVARADRLADDRYDKVEEVVAAEAAARDLAAAEEQQRLLHKVCKERQADLAQGEAAWAERLLAAGLKSPPAAYAPWIARRERLAEALRGEDSAKAALAGALERVEATAKIGMAALGKAQRRWPEEPVELALAVRDAVDASIKEQSANAAKAGEVAAAYRDALDDRPRLVAALDNAQGELAKWQATWAGLAKECLVDPQIQGDALNALLHGYDTLAERLAEMARYADTVAHADRAERDLAADTASLASELGEPLENTVEATVLKVHARLSEATRAHEAYGRLTKALEEAKADAVAAREEVERCRAALAADRIAARLPEDAEGAQLMEAARTSDTRHDLAAKIDDQLARLGQLGQRWPDVEAEFCNEAPSARRAALEAAQSEAETAALAVEEAIARRSGIAVTLQTRKNESREGIAAKAKLRQHIVSSQMAEAVAEAIRLRLEAMVLEAAADAFARENQSPILSRASEIFRLFTAGAYDRLEAAGGRSKNFVEAHRVADDLDVGVDALSDGTRDQLVASVRFAAAQDSPLPFIADDLLVNADDSRAANGFRALAALAEKRQVFYLTHHQHLRAIARSAVGENINIISL